MTYRKDTDADLRLRAAFRWPEFWVAVLIVALGLGALLCLGATVERADIMWVMTYDHVHSTKLSMSRDSQVDLAPLANTIYVLDLREPGRVELYHWCAGQREFDKLSR